MKRHPPEVDAFIRGNCTEFTIRQMAAMSKAVLGYGLTADQIKAYMSRHKIRGMPRKGRKIPERRITTPEIDAFIQRQHHGVSPADMAVMVNAAFRTSFTASQMKGYYSRNHLRSGLDGRFQKGMTPVNKGKKWDEFMSPEGQARSRATTFKPGNIPHNGGAPVGTVRIRHDHKNRSGRPYVWRKVAEPNVWRTAHVVEWEEHNGPVPDGYMVTFANGDTLNWHIDNLILESKAQHAVKNRWGLHGYDKASAQTVNNIADLKMAASRMKQKQRKKAAAAREPGEGRKKSMNGKREPTYGELICRLCQLRDQLKQTPPGRQMLDQVIEELKTGALPNKGKTCTRRK